MNDYHFENYDDSVAPVPHEVFDELQAAEEAAGGAWETPEDELEAVGRTMFDAPQSRDNRIIVLTPRENIGDIPSQSLVRIISKEDGREYLGIVVEGPFAEPDGMRADAPIIVTTTVRGIFMPKYHGRVHIEILGEVMGDGTVVPPRFRPLPNSPVFTLDMDETAHHLKLSGDVGLGLVIGYEELEVSLPSNSKAVLPRHLGILGTTGGGKSTTVSRLIHQLQRADVATIILDTEGEYTEISEPTEDPRMLSILERRQLQPEGVKNVRIMHLVGRETTNPNYPDLTSFSLSFYSLSPYAVMEILELTEAQEQRYLVAYEAAKSLLRKYGVFPQPGNKEHESEVLELDEMEQGYPQLTLEQMYDVVRTCAEIISGKEEPPYIRDKVFYSNKDDFWQFLKHQDLPKSFSSWRALQGKLSYLLRLGIFDAKEAPAPNFQAMTHPGTVTIIDLGDTDSPQINNLVIAYLLRGIQVQQEENYNVAQKNEAPLPRVVVMIEEAHEFLSAARIRQMPVLFQQVARIARRGRKRWLGLVFITQLPQHLPNEVLGLINSYILHKIGDANVISTLKRSIGGIDDVLWDRLRNLAPGQAIVSAPSLARPLVVAIDPTPCKLRLVE
jgi:hypothetical protein